MSFAPGIDCSPGVRPSAVLITCAHVTTCLAPTSKPSPAVARFPSTKRRIRTVAVSYPVMRCRLRLVLVPGHCDLEVHLGSPLCQNDPGFTAQLYPKLHREMLWSPCR